MPSTTMLGIFFYGTDVTLQHFYVEFLKIQIFKVISIKKVLYINFFWMPDRKFKFFSDSREEVLRKECIGIRFIHIVFGGLPPGGIA